MFAIVKMLLLTPVAGSSQIFVWEAFKCSISKYANKRLGRLVYTARVIIPSPSTEKDCTVLYKTVRSQLQA